VALSTLGISRARKQKSGVQKAGLRRDIQGLRALAVAAVIADHLFHWPSGGFVGVDVFFVISGFLITGLLLREYERTGHISFKNFYLRRIKRILPASTAVLVATLVGSYFVFSNSRFMSALWDVVWALFFAGNWRFASVGTDYFQAGGPVSPIQHFWSLAVEEQFYFVWPWLMLLIFLLFARSARAKAHARTAVGAVMVLLCVISFAWAMWETAHMPTQAYFSTFSRAWELGVGALIAVASPLLTRLRGALRPALSWIGLAGIVASLALINSESPFPAPSAALPVFATALVIIAGTGGEQRYLSPLTNPVSQYLGDVSYSLYLWHFPIIIFSGALFDLNNPVVLLLTLAAIVLTSLYGYHLIEDPIRKSSWLSGDRRKKNRAPVTHAYKLTSLSLLAVVTAAVVSSVLVQPPAPVAASIPRPAPAATASSARLASTSGPETTRLQTEIAAALASPEWPALTPSMDDVISGPQAPSDIAACGKMGAVDPQSCTWGGPSATKTAVVIGDSVAMTYVGALREALKDRPEWQLKTYAAFGCTFTETRIAHSDAALMNACPARKDQAVAAINELKPDLVFITNTYEPRIGLDSKAPLTPKDWSDSTRALVQKFSGSAKKVVFLSPPPSDVDIKSCYTRVSRPGDCASSVTGQWVDVANVEGELAKSFGGAFVDSREWFCSGQSAMCPAYVGKTPTKVDKVHMAPDYAIKIGPALAEELVRLQLL